jgi:hypothetical protein
MSVADVFVLGFGTNKKFTSRLIRRISDSWCSHAWIEYSSLSFGGMWAVHAQPEGIIKESIFSAWRKYPTRRRFEVIVEPEKIREAIAHAIALLGRPYDYGVIVNGLKLLRLRRTGRSSRIRRNNYKLHCSEFICIVLRYLEIDGAYDLDPEATYPGKLYEFVSGHPQFRPI